MTSTPTPLLQGSPYPASAASHPNRSSQPQERSSLWTSIQEILPGYRSRLKRRTSHRQGRQQSRLDSSHLPSGTDYELSHLPVNAVAVDLDHAFETGAVKMDTTLSELAERRCRICLETDDDDDDDDDNNNQLISPCLCKGTSQYIHLACLQKWRAASPRHESSYRCDTCHYHYSFSRPLFATVLKNGWFLHGMVTLLFIVILYGFAWCGHALDAHGVWHWKAWALKDTPEVTASRSRVLGLDWADVLWAFVMGSVVGWVVVLVSWIWDLCVDGEQRRIQERRRREEEEQRRRRNRAQASGRWEAPASTGFYIGDAGGEAALYILLLVGIIGAFVIVYQITANFVRLILDSVEETILDVKKSN